MSAGDEALDVLIVGTGPIGLVYGHRLAEAGHRVVWGVRPGRPAVPATELTFRDWGSGEEWRHRVAPRPLSDVPRADLAVVALGAQAWPEALPLVAAVPGAPTLVTLGHNPLGRRAVPEPLRQRTILGFPGVTGHREGDVVEYVRLADQPTTVLRGDLPLQRSFTGSLSREAFACQGVDDDGWFAYRAFFSVTMDAAIVRAGGDAAALARNRGTLRLLSQARREGIEALRAAGVGGLLPGDAVAHHPALAWYWVPQTARQLAQPSGDRAFGVHARRMGPERAWLNAWALALCDEALTPTTRLRELLSGS